MEIPSFLSALCLPLASTAGYGPFVTILFRVNSESITIPVINTVELGGTKLGDIAAPLARWDHRKPKFGLRHAIKLTG
jgi:hypothetical protein